MSVPAKPASHPLKKLARQLLTTTCLTAAAAGAANAGTVNESTFTDFSNSFGGANELPLYTDRIIGQMNPSGDLDFFKLTSLVAGSGYTITGSYTSAQSVAVLNSGGGSLNGLSINPASLIGTVPADGTLVIQVLNQEAVASYDFTVNAQTVPEPSTGVAAALGLAGAWALRRRLKK